MATRMHAVRFIAAAPLVSAGLLLVLAIHPAAQAPASQTLAVAGRGNAAPWIASSGRFVAVSWVAAVESTADVFLATSEDAGRSFGAPVRVNAVAGEVRANGEIAPRVALHPVGGTDRPGVVVAWNARDQGTEIKLARSRDFGQTFAAPVSLQTKGAVGDRGWHSLAVDAQGVAHVAWLDHRVMAQNRKPTDKPHVHGAGTQDGVAMAQQSQLYYATVGPNGTTEKSITPGVCYCCKTALAATPKGVVAAWRHVYAGNMRDMTFAWLSGPTTTAPARMSEDGWSINGCPDDGPALAFGADERVHAVWPTVIPGDEPVGALFYASLGAGGDRFSARQRIATLGTPKPSHPQVSVDGAGHLFFAWDEVVGGVRTAASVEATRAPDGSLRLSTPTAIAPGGPTSYPVMAPLSRGVVVAWTSGAPGTSVISVRALAGDTAMSK